MKIPKSVSMHLFLSNLNVKEKDEKLYTKFKFIRNKKVIKKFKEMKND